MKAHALSRLLFCFFISAAAFGQEVQMNATDHNTGTKDNSTTQSETNHVVTANGVLGAWNDSSQIATLGTAFTSFVGWRGSADGLAFSGGGFLTYPGGTPCWGDPAVVADSSGFLYLAGLVEDFHGIGIARTTGTVPPYSFGTAQILPQPAGGQLDKELMAIDRTGGGFDNRIYIAVTNLSTGRILEAHSTSLAPLTFSAWQSISPNSGSATAGMPAVAPNGNVYVVWVRNDNTYEIVRSTNGGGLWSNPDAGDPAAAKVITTVATPTPTLLSTVGTAIKVKGFPQIAIDSTAAGSPTRGNIYVVYHTDPDGAGADKADVYFTRSTNNGVTWSAPRSITSGLAATIGRDTTTNDNFNPSIAVSPVNGHIYVTFYDRRGDTTAADGDPANTKARVYRALSTDAGQTWNVIPFGANSFVPIAGFAQAGASNNYWGEYNWSTSNANGLQFTWGDSHNLCAPGGGANPCSPAGRSDLDSYYRTAANLSGVDLYIKPWGAVTGEGPTWQTSYIYVVDASDVQVNALKGIVNRLRARVRNLGTGASNNVTVRFKYAPWFAGINDSMLKEIGTATVSLSAAGGGTDDQVVPINWDLTNLADTNGGLWPGPISDFEHFCVKVSVEPASDVNLSNNDAQSNFFDVGTSSSPSSPLRFLVAGPDPRNSDRPAFAQLVVSKLPRQFAVRVTVDGVQDPARGFRLKPNELRRASVRFAVPRRYTGRTDVIADITLLLDGKPVGGISARLYRSPSSREPKDAIGKTTARYWEVKPADRTEKIRGEEGPRYEPPPLRTIPKKVRIRETFRVSYEEAYKVVLTTIRSLQLGPALADHERGLFNTTGRQVKSAEIARLAESNPKLAVDGFYWMSVWLEPHGDREIEIGVDAWIATNDVEAPMGRRLRSNGTLEKSILTAIRRRLSP